MNYPLSEQLSRALNKLCKWRSVFAGWQLGTRPKTDPECQAVRDQREAWLLLRAENTAFLRILFEKKICTVEEFQQALLIEAQALDESLEQRFPGFKTTEDGIDMDVKVAAETTKGWKP